MPGAVAVGAVPRTPFTWGLAEAPALPRLRLGRFAATGQRGCSSATLGVLRDAPWPPNLGSLRCQTTSCGRGPCPFVGSGAVGAQRGSARCRGAPRKETPVPSVFSTRKGCPSEFCGLGLRLPVKRRQAGSTQKTDGYRCSGTNLCDRMHSSRMYGQLMPWCLPCSGWETPVPHRG
jgi:hypothetical protein